MLPRIPDHSDHLREGIDIAFVDDIFRAMQYFKRMVEVVRRDGFEIIPKDKNEPNHRASAAELAEFYRRAEQAHIFVFNIVAGFNPARAMKDIESIKEEFSSGIPVLQSAPFEVFSIEGFGAYPLWRDSDAPKEIYTWCVLLCEQSPGEFMEYHLMGCDGRFIVVAVDHAWQSYVEFYLRQMRREKVGVESVRERVRLGTRDEKRTHTIRRIIHVRPASQLGMPSSTGRPIDWSHRWLVRGHWRKHEGLGKNRAGDYCVTGFTWVTEHQRGPEDAPLIDKTRLVSG